MSIKTKTTTAEASEENKAETGTPVTSTAEAAKLLSEALTYRDEYEKAREFMLQRELNKLDPEVRKTADIWAEHGPGELTFYYKEDGEDKERVRLITFNAYPTHAGRVKFPENATDEERYEYIMLGNYA